MTRSSPIRVVLADDHAVVRSGLGAVLCAMASNEYFSETVRIQKDRGHIVATNGP